MITYLKTHFRWRVMITTLLLLGGMLVVGQPAAAQTVTIGQLQAQLAALAAQLAAVTGTAGTGSSVPTIMPFTRDLTVGSSGTDVMSLQQWLMARGFSIPAGPTTFFGPQTKAAVAAYQSSQGIAATGYFGPLTRASINSLIAVVPPTPTPSSGLPAGCTSTAGYSPTTGARCDGGGSSSPSTGGPLRGGAGDIAVTSRGSGTNDQVVEGESDVPVLGFEIKATGSDVAVTSVEIELEQTGNGSRRLNRYADEVSVMMDGKVIGSADVRDFSESNDVYSYNIPVTATVREGDTKRFYLAVSALGNVDSRDIDEDWEIGLGQIRFEDASGAILTDNSGGVGGDITETFTFEDLSSAGNVQLRVSGNDTAVNDSHTIQVDSSGTTNDVELLSFTLRAEGSDISLNSLPFELTSSGAGVTEIIDDARLLMDGEEVGDVRIDRNCTGGNDGFSATTDTDVCIVVDNLDNDDVVIDQGDSVDFTLLADIRDTTDNFSNGDSLAAVTLNSDQIDADDENGDRLGASDLTGTAESTNLVFSASGITTSDFTTASATQKDYGSSSSPNHQGEYVMTFKVTAFEDPAYIPLTAANTSATNYGVTFRMKDANGNALGTGTAIASLQKVSGQGMIESAGGVTYLHLQDGETATMQLTVNYDPTTSDYARVQLTSINFNTVRAAPNQSYVPLPASDYESRSTYIVTP